MKNTVKIRITKMEYKQRLINTRRQTTHFYIAG